MRFWPRRRPCPPDPEMDAAEKEADRALRDAKQLHERADNAVDRISKTGERNHFAATVARAMRRA